MKPITKILACVLPFLLLAIPGLSQPNRGLPGIVESEESEIIVNTTGIGELFEDALDQALMLAIGEVNGIEISESDISLPIASQYSSDWSTDLFGEEIQIDSNFQEQLNQQINISSSEIKGEIESFKIISSQSTSDSIWSSLFSDKESWVVEVESKVRIIRPAEYQASLQSKRLKIATVPPLVDTSVSSSYSTTIPGIWLQHFSNYMAQSNKVVILDREFNNLTNNELNMLSKASFNSEQSAKLGNYLGADYLVVPSIDNLDIQRDIRTFQLTNRVVEGPEKLNITISYRVLEVATGVIVLSDTYTLRNEENFVIDDVLKDSALTIAIDFILKTFPPKVELIENDIAYLSIDSFAVSNDDEFELFNAGNPIIDSDTGEILGYQETLIGTMIISEVDDRLVTGPFVANGSYQFNSEDQIFAKKALRNSFAETQNGSPSISDEIAPVNIEQPTSIETLRNSISDDF